MIKSGLTSVTFRNLSPKEIIEAVKIAGLEGIEWGGDVHVPPDSLAGAKEIQKMCEDSGIEIPSYGSYYFLNESKDFQKTLDIAACLKAKTIRVWAGRKSSAEATADEKKAIADEGRYLAEEAEKYGIKIALEYHNNTLTDSIESSSTLLVDINNENMFTYWQTHPNIVGHKKRLDSLEAVLKYLANIHINFATPKKEWAEYLNKIYKLPGEHFALIEFVEDNNSLDDFMRDSLTLKSILESLFRG